MSEELTADQQHALGAMVAVYPVATALGERFADAGEELHLVGGTVRDTLLGRGVTDLDFATSAPPQRSERLLRGFADAIWLTGAAFGTVSARKDEWQLEITTYRADSYTAGSRHPEVTFGDSLADDLARRDFTVNAMAVRVPDGRFVDPFGGLRDLRDRLLRTPLDPAVSFGDDPLRLVRLARFAAQLDAEAEPLTRAAAAAMADQLATISRERIRDELSKLVTAPWARRGLDLLVETGLAEQFLPELPALRASVDPLHRHKDVYAHTLAVVESCPPGDLVLRLAALLHDVGKPATRQFHPGGQVSFHHHEAVGARMARARLTQLRYPNAVVEAVSDLVLKHLRFHGYADGPWTDSAVRRYARDAGDDEQLRRLNRLTRADVTTGNRAKADRLARAMDALEERIAALKEAEELAALRPDLDGNAVMALLGIGPGPWMKRIMGWLMELRLEEGPLPQDDVAERLQAWWAATGGALRARPDGSGP